MSTFVTLAVAGAITGIAGWLLLCGVRDVRLHALLMVLTFLGVALGTSAVVHAEPLNVEPVSPEKVSAGMNSLAGDISALAGGMAVPMTLILLFLAIVTFLLAVLFKKMRGVAVGFLIMALVFFLVFGDLKGAVNFVIGTLEWIKGHF